MAFEPTEQQKQALNANGAVLISAAAGSGKTAVLVQRVVKLLSNEEEKIPADRLLIVTFTNSAAAEMKQRIEKAMSEAAAKQSENAYLQNQLLLLPMADICTIDSFCIKLVREYFSHPAIQVAPDFKIIDESRLAVVSDRVLREVFEAHYEAEVPDFENFLKSTDSTYGDENATQLIHELYNFAMSLPFPEKWLKNCLQELGNPVSKTRLAARLFEKACRETQEFLQQATELWRSSVEDADFGPLYAELLNSQKKAFLALITAAENKNWEAVYNLLYSPVFEKIKFTRKHTCNTELKEALKSYFSSLETWVNKLKSDFYAPLDEVERQRALTEKMGQTTVQLCLEYHQALLQELKKQGALTFSLCEQLTHKLLCDETLDTAVSKELSSYYAAVMVDEFQDVNDLQNAIFKALSNNGKCLFAVGDMKQSIYGFRNSNPQNFKALAQAALPYREDLPAEQLKLVQLNRNFRSRACVCDFVNAFFNYTMNEQTGGIYYPEEQLYPKADFPENNTTGCEIITVTYEKGLSRQQAMAGHVAQTVKQLLQRDPFLKAPDNSLRRAQCSDIAILLRYRRSAGEIVAALKELGLEADFSEGSLFKQPEISLLCSLLQAVSDPLNDVALLALLLSPIGGFTANRLAELRKNTPKGRIYNLLLQNREQPDCAFIIEKLANYRRLAAGLSVGAFVNEVIFSENFAERVAAESNGQKDDGNLLYFQSIAEEFSSEPGNDLNAFTDYLNRLNPEKVPAVSTGQEGGIKVMTMHASKGLQFPVCILADCMSMFSKSERNLFTGDPEFGLGFSAVDFENNCKIKSFDRRQLEKLKLQQQMHEEMRLFYVATTRAEELLILQLCDTTFVSKKNNYAKTVEKFGSATPSCEILEASSYGKWVLLFLAHCPDSPCYTLREEVYAPLEAVSAPPPSESAADPEYSANLNLTLNYSYPYTALHGLSVKTSVSALTKQQAAYSFCATARPGFLSGGGLTPAERGTAFHKFMQFADFQAVKNNLESELERLYEQEYLTRSEVDCIDPKKAALFFESELFSRITASKTVLREKRFMLEIPAGELQPELEPALQSQPIMVQGAIDCLFFEADGIVVLDFKTDRITKDEELLAHYSEQLQLYCRAVEKMYATPVKECYLYALYTGRQVPVPLKK